MNEISKSQKTNSHETENEFGEMLYKQSIGLNTKLTNIVNRQRLLINREEYSLYDKQWGIDPLGELFGQTQCGELNYTHHMFLNPPQNLLH